MTDTDKKFLRETFAYYYGKNIHTDEEALMAYYRAEKILKGLDQIDKRGCKCNYSKLQSQTNDLYHAWLKTQEVKIA